jgi:hypothetical protein
MTTIKAAAEPSREDWATFADAIEQCILWKEVPGLPVVRMRETDQWQIVTALRCLSAPAGNDGAVLAEIWRLCDSASHLSKREVVRQIAAIVEANTRAGGDAGPVTTEQLDKLQFGKPLHQRPGNDGDVRKALDAATKELDWCIGQLKGQRFTFSTNHPVTRARDNAVAALAIPQREAGEPVKRNTVADSSGPNPGAIGASKEAAALTGFATVAAASTLPQALEAEPVARRYRFVTGVDGKELSDWFIVDDLRSIPRREGQAIQPLYASPPPIPDAPVGRDALADAEASFEFIRLTLIDFLEEPARSAFWKAVEARNAIRALKPQDGGNMVANEDISTNPAPRLHAFKPQDGGETR